MTATAAADVTLKAKRVYSVSTNILAQLMIGNAIDRRSLSLFMASEFGEDDSSGAWQLRDAYDAGEIAISRYILANKPATDFTTINGFAALAAMLPTHSFRTEEQIAFQQFSTPAAISLLAAAALHTRPDDHLLEPSAGTGMLAALPSLQAKTLHLNELDSFRAELLKLVFPSSRVTNIDAARIHQQTTAPTIAILNPPFSRSQGKSVDHLAFARHLLSALKSLRPGGRAVAILPSWFQNSGRYASAYETIAALGHFKADILLHDLDFQKQGTNIDTRIVVIDKTPGENCRPMPATMAEALAIFQGLDDRAKLTTVLPVARPTTATTGTGLMGAVKSINIPTLAIAKPVQAKSVGRQLDYTAHDAPQLAAKNEGVYIPYRSSRINFPDQKPHPDNLVESSAMASVYPPTPTYKPMLTDTSYAALSNAQLETLVYAGQSFELFLPGKYKITGNTGLLELNPEGNSYRRGYFIGDGTGAGKGREVSSIMMDQWLRGNRRHIWLSKSSTLIEDAQRDWKALGGMAADIQSLDTWKLGQDIKLPAGILFLTYSTLRSERPGKGSRLDQILKWLNPDGAESPSFDGLIVFDEAHAMANAAPSMTDRGIVKGSDQGVAGLKLQNSLPSARVLYVSATGATHITNLSYAARLGLWGEGTSFKDRSQFISTIENSGLSAMEIVARDLKTQGLYSARALSFQGVEYDILEHKLTTEQISIYDTYAEAWQIIHENLQQALESAGVTDPFSKNTLNSAAKSAAMSHFESTKQRFFSQVLLTLKLPTLIKSITADLNAGHACVIQLVSTAEAMLNRRLASSSPEELAQGDIDLSPREHVFDYLLNAFPTQAMESYTNENGDLASRPIYDERGNPVCCDHALELRDNLLERLGSLPGISTALDELIRHFKPENVAEVTGRSKRIIEQRDGTQTIQRRPSGANIAETSSFMSDQKRILVFSDAGGTGRSYHADLNAANQRRRIHYLLEPGWKAAEAVQGLGRTHRTHQAQPPVFRPVTTDVRGEKRFISTIARRLDALGALTRGQRQTGGQNLFNPADNLESPIAAIALTSWYKLLHGGKLTSIDLAGFTKLSGLRLTDEDNYLLENLPPIQRWLNRILAFPIHLQNSIFDEYFALIEARIAALTAAGKLDIGVEDLHCIKATIKSSTLLRTDPITAAETRLLALEVERKLPVLSYEAISLQIDNDEDAMCVRNEKSGRIGVAFRATSIMDEEGAIIRRVRLVRPGKSTSMTVEDFKETNWTYCAADTFRQLWTAEADTLADKTQLSTHYLVSGLLLPVWSKIPDIIARVLRVVTSNGESWIGREVPANCVHEIAKAFEVSSDIELSGAELISTAPTSAFIPVAGTPLTIGKSLVNSARRIEIKGWQAHDLPYLKALGGFTEIIGYKTRLFVPSDDVMTAIAEYYRKSQLSLGVR